MTIYAGTIIDVPGDPFAGDPTHAQIGRASCRERG